MKKYQRKYGELIYVQLNDLDQYILSHGIKFIDFMNNIPATIDNILLLKHQFPDADFNMNTKLAYVPKARIQKLIKDDPSNYNEFCWIDFLEVDGLNAITDNELAELLYIGHSQKYLDTPFYNKLANNFVYLTNSDGWQNKIYYRNLDYIYSLLGRLLANKINGPRRERRLPFLNRQASFPIINRKTIAKIEDPLKLGLVFAVNEAILTRHTLEIPLWILGDFINMDSMYDKFAQSRKVSSDGKLVFDRRNKIWRVLMK